jgi:hypothetical protein
MSVRIGIDVGGQNAVLQYGWDIIRKSDNNKHKQIMTFIIGQLVYDALDEKQKSVFELLNVGTDTRALSAVELELLTVSIVT